MDFLMSRIRRRLFWLRRRCCLVATSFSRIVPIDIEYSVIRCRTVGFDFLMVFSFVDDDCFRVAANVDNIVQVAVRVVERVAKLLMMLCLENHLGVLSRWTVTVIPGGGISWLAAAASVVSGSERNSSLSKSSSAVESLFRFVGFEGKAMKISRL